MNGLAEYKRVFLESFAITEDQLTKLKYQDIPAWDSVGHMALMASLEEVFNIELDIDDIIGFSSYEEGIKILAKYEVKIA